jgi:hypothetical protein
MVRFGMAAAALALMAAPLFAQESTEQLKKELEQLRAEVDGLKAVNQSREIPASGKVQADAMAADESPVMTLFKGTKLSGFVDTSYEFSFNQLNTVPKAAFGTLAANQHNPIRVFDNKDNSFYLNAVQLNLERLADKNMIVGYHIELAFGHDPSIYDTGGVALQEGWVQILAPLGSGLDIRAGKMATLAGAEVIESMNDLNYSRSLLFGFAIPFTSTGVRMAYGMGGTNNDMVRFTLGFNNGWNAKGLTNNDFFVDNNHGKGAEFQIELKPIKDLTLDATVIIANETNGASANNGSGSKRYVLDLVAMYTMDAWTFGLNFDWGSQTDVGAAFPHRAADAGVAVYGKYQVNDWFASVLRVEYWSDDNALVAGVGPVGGTGDVGTGSRIIEFTFTEEFKVAKQLIFRVEIRHDDSNNHNFVRNGKAARGDNTLGFEAIMPF